MLRWRQPNELPGRQNYKIDKTRLWASQHEAVAEEIFNEGVRIDYKTSRKLNLN